MRSLLPYPRLWGIAAAMLATGCATPLPEPGTLVPMPEGSVTTFHRVSSGSYGSANGPVVWSHGQTAWQGRTLTSATSPTAGAQLFDPVRHALVAVLDTTGKPTFSYDPPVGYDWPLAVGKTWTNRHTLTSHARNTTAPVQITFSVEAQEEITVPAGTFKAWRVLSSDSFGEVQRIWCAPEIGLSTIKRVSDRTPSHPLGAGRLEGVLVSVNRPVK